MADRFIRLGKANRVGNVLCDFTNPIGIIDVRGDGFEGGGWFY